jgi:crotonobetainyl-CoA:carnitine CoA-transferase CaiB-like acyl-CoA transferase
MERLGLGAEALMADHPELIYVAISGFGRTGPYSHRPGYDLVAQGMSGIMSVTGHAGSPPMKVSVPIADLTAGQYAAYGLHRPAQDRPRPGRRHLFARIRGRLHGMGGRGAVGLG